MSFSSDEEDRSQGRGLRPDLTFMCGGGGGRRPGDAGGGDELTGGAELLPLPPPRTVSTLSTADLLDVGTPGSCSAAVLANGLVKTEYRQT